MMGQPVFYVMNSQGQSVPATFVTDLNGNPIQNPNPPNTSTIAGTKFNANQYFNAQGDLQGNITSINPNNYLIGPVPAPGVNATLADAISIGLQAQGLLGAGALAGLTTGQPEFAAVGLTAGFTLMGNDYKGSGTGNPQQSYTLLTSDGTPYSVVGQPLVLAFQDWASFALGVSNQVYLGNQIKLGGSTLATQAVDLEVAAYPKFFPSTATPAVIARNQVSGEAGANYNLGSSVSQVLANPVSLPTAPAQTTVVGLVNEDGSTDFSVNGGAYGVTNAASESSSQGTETYILAANTTATVTTPSGSFTVTAGAAGAALNLTPTSGSMSVSGVGSSVGAGSSTIPITGSDSVPISVTSGLLTVGSNQISVSNSTNNSPADSQLQTLDLASDIGLASSAAGATGDQVLDGIDAALLGVSSANSLSLNGVSVGVSGGSATQSSTFGANGYTSYDSSSQTATYQPFNSSSAALTLSGLATAPTFDGSDNIVATFPVGSGTATVTLSSTNGAVVSANAISASINGQNISIITPTNSSDSTPFAVISTTSALADSSNVALPTGLVANELLTNALKHAFVGREGGTITLHSRAAAAPANAA